VRKGAEVRDRDETEELKREVAELREALSVAAHDLKEPLRNLRACAERLARETGTNLEGEAKELLESLVVGSRRSERLVDDLLLYARVLSAPPRLEKVNLSEPLQWALSNLREEIERRGAGVTNDPLPTLRADRGRMIQLFQNLLANAITYRGDSPPRIHVGTRESAGIVEVFVRDHGIGIEKRHVERIFEPFQRLHPQERYPGTGLGLAICRRITEGHGGRIWAEPSPGRGTTFVFTLSEK
jgi:signal transduction histidine kinase